MRVVITGAASGIGFKTAEVLGLAGYEVILTDRTDEKKEQVLSALREKQILCHFW
ncbi:MAG: SDR family NAD(P)-dependent oxidoreductase, partial [Oscillospiraceae bacterium]